MVNGVRSALLRDLPFATHPVDSPIAAFEQSAWHVDDPAGHKPPEARSGRQVSTMRREDTTSYIDISA